MMNCLFGKPATAKARVVRRNNAPCLLVNLGAANPPLVWQFDLEKMSSYVIRLREMDGEWDLGYEIPQGAFTPVAHFDERGDAEVAYRAVQKALARSADPSSRRWGRWLLTAVVILALIWIAVSLANIGHVATSLSPSALSSALEAPVRKQPQQIENGVPMSADDVLPQNVP